MFFHIYKIFESKAVQDCNSQIYNNQFTQSTIQIQSQLVKEEDFSETKEKLKKRVAIGFQWRMMELGQRGLQYKGWWRLTKQRPRRCPPLPPPSASSIFSLPSAFLLFFSPYSEQRLVEAADCYVPRTQRTITEEKVEKVERIKLELC